MEQMLARRTSKGIWKERNKNGRRYAEFSEVNFKDGKCGFSEGHGSWNGLRRRVENFNEKKGLWM